MVYGTFLLIPALRPLSECIAGFGDPQGHFGGSDLDTTKKSQIWNWFFRGVGWRHGLQALAGRQAGILQLPIKRSTHPPILYSRAGIHQAHKTPKLCPRCIPEWKIFFRILWENPTTFLCCIHNVGKIFNWHIYWYDSWLYSPPTVFPPDVFPPRIVQRNAVTPVLLDIGWWWTNSWATSFSINEALEMGYKPFAHQGPWKS